MKSLRNMIKKDKEKFIIPKGVQDTIPVNKIYEDGIFLIGKNKYTKTFKFTDINYTVAGKSDKEGMFLKYSELLNSFDTGATSKLTINNRKINKLDFEKNISLKLSEDELDKFIVNEKILELNKKVVDEFINEIVVYDKNTIKVTFKYENEYILAFDF